MPDIKVMTPQDIPFAVEITDGENWGYTAEDFERLMWFEPEGCFVAFDGDERVGMLTTTSYGRMAWIGNVVVASGRREESIGTGMIWHAVNYLRGRSVETVGLYSYLDSIKFYERMGFIDSFRVGRFGRIATASEYRGSEVATAELLLDVASFDGRYFPGNRRRLLSRMLEDFPDLFLLARADGLHGYIVGFCSPKACEIGPLVCNPRNPHVAEDLIVDCLTALENTESTLAVPMVNDQAMEIIKRLGFKKEFEVSAMFHETKSHGMNLEAIYCIGSLEKG